MNIEKIEIKEKSRKLNATWTVDLQHGEIEISKGLEEQLARTMAEEIDWEIMCDLMTSIGWRLVRTKKSMYDTEDAYNIKQWVAKHCKGNHKARGDTWIFERAEDATWFALKWSS